jgi:hypothetical protein
MTDRLMEIEAAFSGLSERLRGIEAQHAALMKRNGALVSAVRLARITAEVSAARPYYIGGGEDAGAHWAEALKEVAGILRKAEDV